MTKVKIWTKDGVHVGQLMLDQKCDHQSSRIL